MTASLLYRAPQTLSYQWTRDGQAIAGATSPALRAASVGDYGCLVTAANAAGATASAANRASSVFALGKARRNRRRGTALLKVRVPERGRLSLWGKGVKRSRQSLGSGAGRAVGAGSVNLVVKSKGKAKRRLLRRGRARIRLKVTYRPSQASGGTQSRKLLLRRRIH